MPKNRWKPNPEIIRVLKKEFKKMPESHRVAVGGRILAWEDVIKEIEAGTKFGRSYYFAFLESVVGR